MILLNKLVRICRDRFIASVSPINQQRGHGKLFNQCRHHTWEPGRDESVPTNSAVFIRETALSRPGPLSATDEDAINVVPTDIDKKLENYYASTAQLAQRVC